MGKQVERTQLKSVALNGGIPSIRAERVTGKRKPPYKVASRKHNPTHMICEGIEEK